VIRFHLDESADGRLAAALRRRGIDVTTPLDTALVSAEDEQHLAFADAENRVIITQESDFLQLHRCLRLAMPEVFDLRSSRRACTRRGSARA
jgi:predicted nuclease of predicted toxin-antitoxin system